MSRQTSEQPSRTRKPRWWQLYLMLPLLVGLYVPEMRLHLSRTEHVVAQLGILILIYAFLQVWMRANHRALMGIDEEPGRWQVKVYEVTREDPARAHAAATRTERRPVLDFPEGELKGVLSTTFEMDEFERESTFPAGSQVSQTEHVLNIQDTRDIEA